jgi:hypothetical protein
MAKKKLVVTPRPFRVESGPDVGIALQLWYEMVDPQDPGYDLFDDDLLEVVKKNFVAHNEQRFQITYEPGPAPGYTRVFTEFKGKTVK